MDKTYTAGKFVLNLTHFTCLKKCPSNFYINLTHDEYVLESNIINIMYFIHLS